MKKMHKLVNQFEEAVRLHENLGGGHPADIPAKEEYYAESKKELLDAIEEVADKPKSYVYTNENGFLSVESEITPKKNAAIEVMVAEHGKVWINVDGICLLRYMPMPKE